MRELLERLAAGEDFDQLLAEFKALPRAERETPTGEQLQEAEYANDFNLDDGFADVEAAYMGGDITDEQYQAIRKALTEE